MPKNETRTGNNPLSISIPWERAKKVRNNIDSINKAFSNLKLLRPSAEDVLLLINQILRDDLKVMLQDSTADGLVSLHVQSIEKWNTGLRQEETNALAELHQKITLFIEIGERFSANIDQLLKAQVFQLDILRVLADLPNLDSIYMFRTNNKTDFWLVFTDIEHSVSLSYEDTFIMLEDRYPHETLDFMIIEKKQLIVEEMPPYALMIEKP